MNKVSAPPDGTAVVQPAAGWGGGEQRACDCTSWTDTRSDRNTVTIRHRRACPLRPANGSDEIRHLAGTLDAVLDDAFGPADAGTLLAAVVAERFGSVTA